MAKYLTKLSKFGGQYRVTIPKGLIAETGWGEVEFIILEKMGHDEIRLRRWIDAKSLKSEAAGDKAGSD